MENNTSRRIEIKTHKFPANLEFTVRGYQTNEEGEEELAWSETSQIGTDGFDSKEQCDECVKDELAEQVSTRVAQNGYGDVEYDLPIIII